MTPQCPDCKMWLNGFEKHECDNPRICKQCGSSNIYQQCSKCIDWKLPLQEKPPWK